MLIKFVSKARGFLLDLISNNYDDIAFVYEDAMVYETNSNLKVKLAAIVKQPIFDYLGLFQVLNVSVKEDCVFSYNRFLKSNKPYIMYLENPLAPVHYSINRPNTFISKRKLKDIFEDKNFKAIVGLSKACESTVRKFYDIPANVKVMNIYPYVKIRKNITLEEIEKKAYNDTLKLLYISSDFELKGGQDIIEALKKIESDLELTIVTKVDSIANNDRLFINKNSKKIKLFDFNLSKDELATLYMDSNILLNPTRQDSFSLVTLEAMKYGNAVISSDMYAIKEMISDGKEGFLTKAKFDIWTEENLPNRAIWNNRKKTIYSSFVDEHMVNFLCEKINTLNRDRKLLGYMEINAYLKSTSGEFSEEYILSQWKNLFEKVMGRPAMKSQV